MGIEAEISKKKREEKIKELKKDKELEEMLRLSHKSGAKSIRNISLDWMYKGEITRKSKSSNSLEQNIRGSEAEKSLTKSNSRSFNDNKDIVRKKYQAIAEAKLRLDPLHHIIKAKETI